MSFTCFGGVKYENIFDFDGELGDVWVYEDEVIYV